MQNRELNTCKQDIYSFLRFSFPTKPEPSLARLFRLRRAVRRTIVIEVGMQNAAQAIAVATSPLIFDSGEMAVPAIVYALVMNVVLLSYLKLLPKCTDETASEGA